MTKKNKNKIGSTTAENKLDIKKPTILFNRKYLYNFYDLYISKLQAQGMFFFALNINILGDLIEISKSFNTTSKDLIINSIGNINLILSQIEAIDFAFIAIEHNKNNKSKAHLHIIIGIRSITEEYKHIYSHILEQFNNTGDYYDLHLRYLSSFIKIKTYFKYLSKEFHEINPFCNHIHFFTYSNQNKNIHKIFINHFQELQDINTLDLPSHDLDTLPMISNYFKHFYNQGKYYNIPGFNFNIKTKNHINILIIYYINLYLIFHNMFVNHSNIYIKNKKSLYSYIYMGDINYLIDNIHNIQSFIINNFKTINKDHLFTNIINHKNKVRKILIDDTNNLYNKTINYNFIEFKDGIYSMEHDTFIHKNNISIYYLLNLTCTKFYNKNYKHISRQKYLKPKTWLKFLNKNIPDNNIIEFCTNFGKYFYYEKDNTKIKDKKKDIMFIKGISSSGKTTLLTDQLINSWGKENIASITDNTDFAFETIKNNTKIIINDEYEYDSKHRSNLLKLFNNKTFNQNIKNKKIEDNFNTRANIILLGNDTIKNNNMIKDLAFQNRLDTYYFQEKLDMSYEDILKIKEEEANIIIYCHKLYHQNKIKNKKQKRFTRTKLIKLIEK